VILSGVRVIDFGRYIAGPYAGALLGDFGAEVIRVEKRDGSEDRYLLPVSDTGDGALFMQMNRNKRSITLDPMHETGRAIVRRLVATADVVVANLPPPTLAAMGLDYASLCAIKPDIILAAISAYGTEGPYKDRVGFDGVFQAMSGSIYMTGNEGEPYRCMTNFVDYGTALSCAYGVALALLERERTGRGQLVETSLIESSIAFLAENAANYFEGTGPPPSRATRTHLAQVFALVAGDGKPFVIHLSSPPKFWAGLLAATGRADLGSDERFATRPARVKNYDALEAELSAVFATGDRATWLAALRANDVPCGPLNDFREVFDDPQVVQLGLKHALPHPKRGTVSVVGSPVRLSDTPVVIATAAPELGADTATYVPPKEHR